MSVRQLRAAGAVGLVAVVTFFVAFVVDPQPPTAGASATVLLEHQAASGTIDRAAAFLLGISAAALVAFVAGVRAWFESISSAPRWWGSAMFGGAVLTASSLLVFSALFFTTVSHAPPSAPVLVYLNDAANYGFVFAGFGSLITIGFLAALMLATGGPLGLLGRLGALVVPLLLLFLATAFFSNGPLVAGGFATIAGFAATGIFLALTALSMLWFARLMQAAAKG